MKRWWKEWQWKRRQKGKDRTWDFEARCGGCGKRLNLVLYVSSQYLILLRIDKVCEEHPKESMILWPQLGVRPDIIRVEYDREEECGT
jgi:hypothetical protein